MIALVFLGGHELVAVIDEQETIVTGVAEGSLKQDAFVEWVRRGITSATAIVPPRLHRQGA
ncbi:MAG: hypothetical protein ACKO5P_04030 [Nodosilinea sp.]